MSHEHDDTYECGKCGQTFETERDMKDHAKDEHDVDV